VGRCLVNHHWSGDAAGRKLQNRPGRSRQTTAFSGTDINFPDIDNSQLLYPIRGSYDWYVCHANEVGFPPGRNCNIYKEPSSTGFCYKTTFGDWNCTMIDRIAVSRGPELQPVAPPK